MSVLVARKYNISADDVFVIIGDSIAFGAGTNNQSYTGSLGSTMWHNGEWKAVADPTKVGAAGSQWPLLVNLVEANAGVKIRIINCGVGSTLLKTHWQKGNAIYTAMASAITASGVASIKAFIMHVGANDVVLDGDLTRASFNAEIDSLAEDLVADYPGSKLFLAQLGQMTSGTDEKKGFVRDACSDAWGDNSNCPTGPILLPVDVDDGVHYQTDAHLLAVANLWWNAIKEIV